MELNYITNSTAVLIKNLHLLHLQSAVFKLYRITEMPASVNMTNESTAKGANDKYIFR